MYFIQSSYTDTNLLCYTEFSSIQCQGVISKEKLDSFYIPLCCPMDSEVNNIIEEEGSFEVNKMMMHDPYDGTGKALLDLKMVALRVRAVFEPIIVQHFAASDEIMDDFVRAVERHLISSGALEARLSGQHPFAFLCLSLTRAM
jgi:jasmonate O-methyltransferase